MNTGESKARYLNSAQLVVFLRKLRTTQSFPCSKRVESSFLAKACRKMLAYGVVSVIRQLTDIEYQFSCRVSLFDHGVGFGGMSQRKNLRNVRL